MRGHVQRVINGVFKFFRSGAAYHNSGTTIFKYVYAGSGCALFVQITHARSRDSYQGYAEDVAPIPLFRTHKKLLLYDFPLSSGDHSRKTSATRESYCRLKTNNDQSRVPTRDRLPVATLRGRNATFRREFPDTVRVNDRNGKL